MLSYNLKVAMRNLRRRKLYTAINLIGLSIACAFCILIYWYDRNEKSFDKFHSKGEFLYRLELRDIFHDRPAVKQQGIFSFLHGGEEESNLITTPLILAAELKREFPEIEQATRMVQVGVVTRINGQAFKESNNTGFVDPSFFTVFDFPFKEGNPSSALEDPQSVVISESTAKKYFGRTDVLGQRIQVLNLNNAWFIVSGVIKDFPSTAGFRFDLLFKREADLFYKDDEAHGLNSFSDVLVLQLQKEVNLTTFNQKLNRFGKEYFKPTIDQWAQFPGSNVKAENFNIILRPFAEAHYQKGLGWMHYTDRRNLYALGSIGVIILIIASLNYILLSLTGTVSRSKEVGIRKITGAERRQIVFQFYIETQLLSFLAVALGLLLAIFALPLFNNLTNAGLNFSSLNVVGILGSLVILGIVLGFVSGIYPAFVMSGLKPLSMVRRFVAYRLSPYLSTGLVTIQFSICIILIIFSMIIGKQMRFTNAKELGFDKSQVVSIESPYSFGDFDQALRIRNRLYQYAASEPAIENVTSTYFPYKGYNTNNHTINDGKVEVGDFNVDYNYFSFFNIPIVKGRTFSPMIASDSIQLNLSPEEHSETGSAARQAVVVNETLYNLLGSPPLDVINRSLGAKIIGVCKDYYADDLTKKIGPAYHRIEKNFIGYFWIKIRAGHSIAQTLEKLKAYWNKTTGSQPFTFTFLDDDVAKSYNAYQRWMKTINIASLIAIMISCMGLFGLSGLKTVARIKEMGIRKVLGASAADLFLVINRGTFMMAFLAFAIALPIAIYISNAWLQNFAYRIHPGSTLYGLAGLISLLTAILAVSYHSIRAARANPVESLRSE